MFKNVRPLGNDILIQRIPNKQTTTGGIYIPDEANEFANKLYKAEVLDIGHDVRNIDIREIVLCKYHTGIEIDYDVIIMKAEEVIGRF